MVRLELALALAGGYDVKATPTIIVLGKNARVLYRGHRPPENWASL
jgi:protein-disulfide isomerase